jgi:Cu(I)/Ag(I) efflux system periplasmic protein CusF
MKFSSFIAVAAVALFGTAFTQASVANHGPPHAAATASAAIPTSDGEVRKVDKQQGKVTLKHGPYPTSTCLP